MKKGTKIILIIVGILVLIGLAYYFLIYKPSKASERGGSNGSNGSNGGGNGGGGNAPSFAPKDLVYLATDKVAWAGDNGIPVYRQPVDDSIGSFLEGVTRGDWYPGQSIGKVMETKPGWVKVGVNNLQIWKFIVNTGYTTQIGKLTGNYWFSDKALYKL